MEETEKIERKKGGKRETTSKDRRGNLLASKKKGDPSRVGKNRTETPDRESGRGEKVQGGRLLVRVRLGTDPCKTIGPRDASTRKKQKVGNTKTKTQPKKKKKTKQNLPRG